MRNTGEHHSNIANTEKLKNKTKLAQLKPRRHRKATDTRAVMILIGFLVGSVTGYLFGIRTPSHDSIPDTTSQVVIEHINPPQGYALPARFGNIGPQLITAGAIDVDKFIDLYEQSGQPLTTTQVDVLMSGSDEQIIINRENATFLLNLFWALGLANENIILTEGMMMYQGVEGVVNFASTGGWTLGRKSVEEIYASTPIIALTDEEQVLLHQVAGQIFRPCCNNPTSFPDCNHGMAMLGMLELMISQGASEQALFETAKYINAFWFLPQNFELATYFSIKENMGFDQVEPRTIVGRDYASAEGFRAVHQWLSENNQLQEVPGNVNNCGV